MESSIGYLEIPEQRQQLSHYSVSSQHDVWPAWNACKQLLIHIQDWIFHLTKEELLSKSKQYIQTWIQNTKTYIQTKLKILAKQQHTNSQDIWQFFQIQ